MNTIINEWETKHAKNKEQPVFFTVRYRTLNTSWQYFRKEPSILSKGLYRWGEQVVPGERLSYTCIKEAEELAEQQSVVYIRSLVGVFLGDSDKILSLWEDGECIYEDNLNIYFQGKDYGDMWY